MAIVSANNGFCIDGHVGFFNVTALRIEGDKYIERFNATPHGDDFAIDLSQMRDDSAVTLSLILCWMRRMQKKQCRIQLMHVPLSLARMAKMFGLSEFII